MDTFTHARKLLGNTMPFGMIEIIPIVNNSYHKVNRLITESGQTDRPGDFSIYFRNDSRLVYTIFMAPSGSNQLFHQIQRRRKIWWRKISASPGRYNLSDIQSGDNTWGSPQSLVNINAKFEWGNQLLETIHLFSKKHPKLSNVDLLIKDGKKEVPAAYVQCETNLSNLFLNSLCDAYEEPLFQGENRPLLRFHRKIAPFKISFCFPTSLNTESLNEIQDLALYLTQLLKNQSISTLHLPSNVRKSLEAQYKQYDELGIPFNIYLNEGTLKDGIAWLRSRDSTLKEQVHVAELVRYIEKIYQNF